MKRVVMVIASLILTLTANASVPVVKKNGESYLDVNYGHFRALVDCSLRTAILIKADVMWSKINDKGDRVSTSVRKYEPKIPFKCNPVSTYGYTNTATAIDYRSFSLIPPALLGSTEMQDAIKMPFTIPYTKQASFVVQSLTLRVACMAKKTGHVKLYTGPIYTKDRQNDFFYTTHGQLTPNGYFMVAIANDGELMSVLIPNHSEATPNALKQWLKPVESIELLMTVKIPVNDDIKQRYPSLWSEKCDI